MSITVGPEAGKIEFGFYKRLSPDSSFHILSVFFSHAQVFVHYNAMSLWSIVWFCCYWIFNIIITANEPKNKQLSQCKRKREQLKQKKIKKKQKKRNAMFNNVNFITSQTKLNLVAFNKYSINFLIAVPSVRFEDVLRWFCVSP